MKGPRWPHNMVNFNVYLDETLYQIFPRRGLKLFVEEFKGFCQESEVGGDSWFCLPIFIELPNIAGPRQSLQ